MGKGCGEWKKAQKRIQTERKTKGSVAFHNNDTSGDLQPKELRADIS